MDALIGILILIFSDASRVFHCHMTQSVPTTVLRMTLVRVFYTISTPWIHADSEYSLRPGWSPLIPWKPPFCLPDIDGWHTHIGYDGVFFLT